MGLPRLLLGVLTLTAGAVVAWVVVVVIGTEPAPTSPVRHTTDSEAVDPALATLREWDAGRARAWASADVDALRSLYLPGSAAGAQDVAMLQRWRERGLRVTGMQTQTLAARVAEQSPDRLVLVVTDRLARAVATGRGQRALLPLDGPTVRRVTLRLVGGVWLMASVMPWPDSVS